MLQKKQQEREVSDSRQREVSNYTVKDTKLTFCEGATFQITGWTTIERGENANEVNVFKTSLGFLNIEPRDESRHYLEDGQTRYRPEGELDKEVQKARQNPDKQLGEVYGNVVKWAKGKTFICKYKRINTDNGKKSVLNVYLLKDAPKRGARA